VKDQSNLLATIIEQESEEEKTEMRESDLCDDHFIASTHERISTVYLNNMLSMKSRTKQKSPFNFKAKKAFSVSSDISDIPEEEEGISRYESLYAPLQMIKEVNEPLPGDKRGSECYCC